MDLENVKKVHFIGIGGIGMSALARLFLHESKQVSGSDRSPSAITDALEKEGVLFYSVQKPENITAGTELVVYSDGVAKGSEGYTEIEEAKRQGIPTMSYFEVLGVVANRYYLVVVAGAHGKTTTTAMLIDIFEYAGLDPTAVVGSLRTKTRSNFRAGKSKYMIVEADEWKRHFTNFTPDVFVITNIEHEHVDYYKNLQEVQKAFIEVAQKVPADGAVVANLGDEKVVPVVRELQCTVINYGKYVDSRLMLTQPGLHNQLNAAAATAAAEFCGIEPATAKAALMNFAGTWRRFEYKGEVGGAKVHDDYSHHPTEIRAALQGAREWYPEKNIVVAFQPHTYTRTAELFDDFVDALSKSDRVILAPIYAAREENVSGVSSEKLVEAINKKGGNAEFIESLDGIAQKLKKEASASDVILVMGAGDVTKVAQYLVAHDV